MFQVLKSKLDMKERQNVTKDTVHLKNNIKTKKKCC